jgi:hypothetical protein
MKEILLGGVTYLFNVVKHWNSVPAAIALTPALNGILIHPAL